MRAPTRSVDVDGGRPRRPAQHPRGEQRPSGTDHPAPAALPDRRAEAAQAEATIGDDGDPAGAPHAVHGRDEVDRRAA